MSSKYFDWYDFKEVEKLYNIHTKKGMDLLRKKIKAKEKGDEEAFRKVNQALLKYRELGDVYKKKVSIPTTSGL